MVFEFAITLAIIITIVLLIIDSISSIIMRKSENLDMKDNLLSCDELNKHAKDVAANHSVFKGVRESPKLLMRLRENYSVITKTKEVFEIDVNADKDTLPAAEWILDNYYIIQEIYVDLENDLVKGYADKLPVISSGIFKNYPRSYAIAVEILSHTDGEIDEDIINTFMNGYQSANVLNMDEVWALQFMLKLAAVEYIRQLCDRMQSSRKEWQRAFEAAGFIKENISLPYNILEGKFNEKYKDISRHSFVERMIFYLRMQNVKSSQIIPLLNSQLEKEGFSADGLIEAEHYFQSWLKLAMGNLITCVRSLGTLDFGNIFKRVSFVEQILTQDPCGIYNLMDNDTKEMYRNKIEALAQIYGTTEIHIAKTALSCAAQKVISPYNHIGYYLVDDGVKEVAEKAKIKKHLNRDNKLFLKFEKVGGYQAVIVGLSILISAWVTWAGFGYDLSSRGVVTVLAFVVCLIPAMELATILINFVAALTAKPRILPKIELKDGIPEDSSVMVIIPTLLSSVKRTGVIITQLRNAYLSNKLDNVYFTLVGDLKDAETETLPDDNEIINEAERLIESLNREYCMDSADRFFFVHRKRNFCEKEKKWMVWERKRGAVLEFVRLLKGDKNTGFEISKNKPENIQGIKYIITLDADTVMPPDCVRKLTGIMRHPLNKPVIDSTKGIVTSGYGLIQPAIGIDIKSSMASTYSMVYASKGGIDTYSGAISNVYQDLFGEGIFTGKGIFDVDIYYSTLNEALPENKVLSHDILEGIYMRTGLATDITLIDSFPSKYNSAAMRLHRWVRGDWQNIGYLKSYILNSKGEKSKNPINSISKWKIFDNIRRSLLSPFMALLVLMMFTVLPFSNGVWIAFFLIVSFSPLILYLLNRLFLGKLSFIPEKSYAKYMSGLTTAIILSFFNIAFMPHQAYLMFDAIAKTITRMVFTKKNMLEWTTAADMEVLLKNKMISYLRFMWASPIFGIVLLGLSLTFYKEYLLLGILLFITFLLAPMIAFYLSQPVEEEEESLKADDVRLLRKIAMKNWAFYEDFSGREDNFLPPDNYQEEPTTVVAHRTSPTNIGFLMLSYLGAKDIGFIAPAEFLELLDKTITTIETLEKWNGHLYNWYDTKTLSILRPAYVSTVDSGNLAGYLIVLISALEEKEFSNINLREMTESLFDIASIYNEEENGNKINIEKINLSQNIDEKNISEVLTEWRTAVSECNNTWSYWIGKLNRQLEKIDRAVKENSGEAALLDKAQSIKVRIRKILDDMNFTLLYEPNRHLFSIGYNVEEGRLTKSYYDLLASEARLASFIAVSRGEIPAEHWFRLGRKLVKLDGYRGLVSWTGTMFEYFMPLLVMDSSKGTILSETYDFVVQNQIKHGELREIPWGVSESGYNAFDVSLNYQYKAFGIAELALKRGLENDVVIAPYASAMALMVEPEKAIENIRKIINMKACGKYGLYEAIDFTPQRILENGGHSIVKSYMAHHQGMGLIAIVNRLKENIMQKRFGLFPEINAISILMQERLPEKTIFNRVHHVPILIKKPFHWEYKEGIRKLTLENRTLPAVQLLSNGAYSVMVTDTGLGYSKVYDTGLYRWSRDITAKKTGFFIFVQNMNSNEVWSVALEPLYIKPDEYSISFAPDKALFTRIDGTIETKTEITVSPEDNVEIRRVTLINHGEKVREVEVTSYMEVTLTAPQNDQAHPVFSNLFIRTEYCQKEDTLVASRRPRMEGQPMVWCFEKATVEGEEVGSTSFETDRFKFLGRNRDISNPSALDVSRPLTNSQGAVIDPVFAIRKRVSVAPGSKATICFTLGMGESKERVLWLSQKYGEIKNIARTFELSFTRSHIEASFLNLKPAEFVKYMEYVPLLMLFSHNRRPLSEYISKNSKGQSGLWTYGISGDIPIMTAKVSNLDELAELEFIINSHEFYRHRGVYADLVLLTEDEDGGYIQALSSGILSMLNGTHLRDMVSQKGGIFILDVKKMPEEDINLIVSFSAFYIDDLKVPVQNTLFRYIDRGENNIKYKIISDGRDAQGSKSTQNSIKLLFDNSYGGFSEDGREYLIHLEKGRSTPLPWTNVISNESFGFQITESGSGCTWAENGRENKLTLWSNDPVTDPAGEIIYICDSDKNTVYTATPQPKGEADIFTVRHGIGYSVFEQETEDLRHELTVFAAAKDSVKLSYLKLSNKTEHSKKLTLTYYVRPVMGVSDIQTMRNIVTDANTGDGYITAQNSINTDFSARLLFVGCSEKIISFTCDREEFLGLDGDLREPRAMNEGKMTGRVGAGFDPCISYTVEAEIKPGTEKEFVFLLGQGISNEEITGFINKFSKPEACKKELESVKQRWAEIIDTITVSTPDKSMDIMLNSWLLYQVVSCRLWARAAFYQSGGAFGFRDQLQDVMAIGYIKPNLVKRQILLHASRQFFEGDVQHWWHEPDGKGIRTRYSDDLLWMPYVTCDYIKNTGDFSILDETVGFLESPVLSQGEDERYEVPAKSDKKATIYEHCIKALEIGIRRGPHGIPLMGGGDWNDGMNTVGNKGTGESVWLGWFLYDVLKKFIPICQFRQDTERSASFSKVSEEIAQSIEKSAWDGNWYMRAFFDDGTPLGSSRNSECTIDSLAQSWAAISGAGSKERVEEALNSVEKYLVDNEVGIIKLLTPPFDKSDLHPGYIKSYLPGVRENGGQYTHASTWVVLAFAKMGLGDRAAELYNMINPINHTRTKAECQRYKTEPYVMSADVYAVEPNVGRGGWSWYTGAAGWMYRVGIEHILGIKKDNGCLLVDPCIPSNWEGYKVKIREGKSLYTINISNPEKVCSGVKEIVIDEFKMVNGPIKLIDDGKEHIIDVVMGKTSNE